MAAAALVEAQTPARPYRIGWLGVGSAPTIVERNEGDLQLALKDLGYIDGHNVVIEYRYAGGDMNRLPQLASELVATNVSVIVAAGDSAALALKRATRSIPVVITEVAADPVRAGIVTSLARPEANVTGLVTQSDELWEKRLSVFKRLAPTVTRAAVLWNPANPANAACIEALRATAPAQGMKVEIHAVTDVTSIDEALAELAREKPDALIACWDSITLARAPKIADFAVNHRLPSLAPIKEYVEAGMLMSLGTDLAAHRRRAALYIDKVLKGAKPSALPVERPLQFDFVINLRTAKALGISPAPELLIQAQEVVQ